MVKYSFIHLHVMGYDQQINELIKNALAEDIGNGDHSTLCCIPPQAKGKAILKVKENGIVAGILPANKVFMTLQHDIFFKPYKKDGEAIFSGDIAFEVEGNISVILAGERLALNIMQRMSGIATLTKKYVDKIKGYPAKILDTRKTTPNFRLLEKEAVRIGGGTNHRFGLYDMILIKDNHIDYCGGIKNAITKANDYVARSEKKLKIEIETRSVNDVKIVMEMGKVDRIMLDNFSVIQMSEALNIINAEYETEASGGITLESIESYAATGVDFISCGAITHHATSLDLSLKARIV